MSTFVLVHGGWQGRWAWERVAPLLEEAGHGVVTPDLPGHGDDRTPPGEVSLGGYAGRVVGALDSLEEPAILVGHSMSGMAISEAAERCPEGVETLVYVNAYLLPDGVSALQMSQRNAEAPLTRSVQADEGRGVLKIVPPQAARDALFGECSEEDAAWAVARLGDEPIAPAAEPVSLTEGNFGRVPRVYVTCLRDRAITPSLQREMYTEVPCREVVSMQTDHSPFLSRPKKFARHLTSLATA